MTESELLEQKLALLGVNITELVDYNTFGQLVDNVDAIVDKLGSEATTTTTPDAQASALNIDEPGLMNDNNAITEPVLEDEEPISEEGVDTND